MMTYSFPAFVRHPLRLFKNRMDRGRRPAGEQLIDTNARLHGILANYIPIRALHLTIDDARGDLFNNNDEENGFVFVYSLGTGCCACEILLQSDIKNLRDRIGRRLCVQQQLLC